MSEIGVVKKAIGALRAYHGSPHDFDRFDLSKIGTGEGAQSYGHGLYFAENEGVARSYRNTLGGDPKFQFTKPDGSVADVSAHAPDRVTGAIGLGKDWVSYPAQHALNKMRLGMTLDDAIENMRKEYPHFHPNDLEIAESHLRQANPTVLSGGHMYEVGIDADPSHMLDYDKQFSEQSPVVQEALRSLPYQPHRFTNNDLGSSFVPRAPMSAQRLNSAGVPGVQYLDAGSRKLGEGSRNFVIFDPARVDIMRKYGIAAPAAAGAAASSAPGKEDPQSVPEAFGEGGVVKKATGALADLIRGRPSTVKIPGVGEIPATPIAPIQSAADSYLTKMGREGAGHIVDYPQYDPEMAKRIAQAYEEMKHAPGDPAVKRSYDALIDETLAQYHQLKDSGIDFKFLKDGQADPYARSPALGYHDIKQNGRLWVFPTDQGYGSLSDINDNPLLKRVGKVGDLDNATANDAFRVVHDAYGHFGPGNPFFRAPGEDRAWLNHSRMFTDDALPAMTSETRGQNSWLNAGPHAQHNATALGGDTIYADQKAGIMPRWTMEQGPLKTAADLQADDRQRALDYLKGLPIGKADGGKVGGDDWKPDPLADAPFGERYVADEPAPFDGRGGELFDKSRRAYAATAGHGLSPTENQFTPSERLARSLAQSSLYSGNPDDHLKGAQTLVDIAGMVPGLNGPLMLADAKHDYDAGDNLGLGVDAAFLGAPFAKPIARGLKAVATSRIMPHIAAGAVASEALNPDDAQASFAGRMAKGFNPETAASVRDWILKYPNEFAQRDKWRQTGYMVDHAVPGNPAKFEIDDSTSKLNRHRADYPGGARAGDVLDHPELFSNYPHLADIPLVNERMGEARGFYDPHRKVISVDGGLNDDDFKGTLLHELQHGIQHYEGWPGGSNLDYMNHFGSMADERMKRRLVRDYFKFSGNEPLTGDTYRAWVKQTGIHPNDFPMGMATFIDKSGGSDANLLRLDELNKKMGPVQGTYDAYRRHPGENEASNVQTRMPFSAAERRDVGPGKTAYVKDHVYTMNPHEDPVGAMIKYAEHLPQ